MQKNLDKDNKYVVFINILFGLFMTPKLPKDQRYKEIVNAAMKCFAKKGYHKTTINDITKEANLTKGGVYWHFKSKLDIFLSVIDEYKIINEDLSKKAQEALSDEYLIESGINYIKKMVENRIIVLIMSELFVESMRGDEVIQEELLNIKTIFPSIKEIFKSAYVNGMLRKIDFNSFDEVIELLLMGLSQKAIMNSSFDFEAVWKSFCDVIFRGLIKK